MRNAEKEFPATLDRGGDCRKKVGEGWVFRNWNWIRHVAIRTKLDGEPLEGCLVVAWGEDWLSPFTFSVGTPRDLQSAIGFFRRPSFHGLKLLIDPVGDASKPESCTGEVINL